MIGFEYGYKRAMLEFIGGCVFATVISIFVSQNFLNTSMLLFFKLINMLGTIFLILAIPCWSTEYMLGWLFGLFILLQAKLVGFWDFVIYFGISFLVLIWKFFK